VRCMRCGHGRGCRLRGCVPGLHQRA
jgi:hypothetical protein